MSGWSQFINQALAPVSQSAATAYSADRAAESQEETNEMNVSLQRENRSWEERMANTAYQRSRDDMVAAGLNPMLMASQGGATTPNVSAAHLDSPAQYVAKSGSSALQSLLEVASLKEDIANKRSQQKVNNAAAAAATAQALSTSKDAEKKNMENQVIAKELPGKMNIAEKESQSSQFTLWLRDFQRGVDAINPFKGMFR